MQDVGEPGNQLVDGVMMLGSHTVKTWSSVQATIS
jgi:hypothetical protein